MKRKLLYPVLFISLISIGIILAFIVSNNRTPAIDEGIANIFAKSPSTTVEILEAVSHIASKPFIVTLLVLFVIVLAFKKNILGLITVTFAVVIGNYSYKYVKVLIQRDRPTVEGTVAEGYSFPSGHVTMGVILYGLIVYFLFQYVTRSTFKKISLIVALILVVVIGLSRLVTEEHYFTDVIGGYCLGGAILVAAMYGYEYFRNRLSRSVT
ncbi:phosphatase PAP2 family protein [Alkalihalobacillus sp. CinArs1]|uniref:phosphatase PAP2 family protein n=1 Tax=Alkalihalobacillus sp. CinArs1 TaxID=2995314 RepID=UPI0022DD96B6|nr:phosphatase PAP2 family protein [Alkalihalobacillus sp. CinArs1]